MRRPSARLSELAFTFVAGLFVAYGIVATWPQPALDVSPAWCRPKYTPFTGDGPTRGLPPAYRRYTR